MMPIWKNIAVLGSVFLCSYQSYAAGGLVELGTEPEGYPSRIVIVSHQVEHPMVGGEARMLARSLGAIQVDKNSRTPRLVYRVGIHHKSGGVVEQAKAIFQMTGQKVAEIHTVGHTQSGFVAPDDYYQLMPYLAAQLKPYVTDDVRIVFHGCSATRQGGYMTAFLKKLPENAEIFGHANPSQPGEVFDWVRWDKNGKKDIGREPVIDVLLPRVYVQWWAELNSRVRYQPNPSMSAFQAWLSPGNLSRIPTDVEELMRQLMR